MRVRYGAAVCLFFLFATMDGRAQGPADDLDSVVQRMLAQEGVVGASVLVRRGDKILLHKGYGFADLGLEAATKEETVYHVVGPMLPFTGIAVMQQMERGKLSLDDDIAKYVPEFPLAGTSRDDSAAFEPHFRDCGLSLPGRSD